MYLPIYVVRHYVANFYFPLLLCTHTFIYSDVISPFFLSVLKVSTQFFHDADFIGAHTWQKHAIFLPTIATVKQSQLNKILCKFFYFDAFTKG